MEIILPNKNKIAPILNPFQKESIVHISIDYYKQNLFKEPPYWKACVEFKNNKTSGKQETNKCEDYDDCIKELQQILDSIK